MTDLYMSTDIPISQECRCRRFWFFYHDIRAFTTSVSMYVWELYCTSIYSSIHLSINYLSHIQWLPQPVFVIWRVFLALYSLVWLIVHPVIRGYGAKWLIYYTDLAYVWLVLMYILLAIVTVLYTVQMYVGKRTLLSKPLDDSETPPEVYSKDNIDFFVKFVWFMYVNALSTAPVVLVGFYGTVVETFEDVDVASVHVHGINLLLILLDLCFSRMPIQILHFPWAGTFDVAYIIFTGIYFAAGGTDIDGNPYIYTALDYGDSPAGAFGFALLLSLPPFIVHIIMWSIVLLRNFIYKKFLCSYRDIYTDTNHESHGNIELL